eukprot:TRINITY_DN864_c0_g1_i1.p1 TRINITY_DN864_c0_g1~~TRINITY_DN864_c0_g1_i1.p1  ORF type:complete len:201 (+),score=-14.38 TRINITY_DN864_c0_g1_i1:220-822(+)
MSRVTPTSFKHLSGMSKLPFWLFLIPAHFSNKDKMQSQPGQYSPFTMNSPSHLHLGTMIVSYSQAYAFLLAFYEVFNTFCSVYLHAYPCRGYFLRIQKPQQQQLSIAQHLSSLMSSHTGCLWYLYPCWKWCCDHLLQQRTQVDNGQGPQTTFTYQQIKIINHNLLDAQDIYQPSNYIKKKLNNNFSYSYIHLHFLVIIQI